MSYTTHYSVVREENVKSTLDGTALLFIVNGKNILCLFSLIKIKIKKYKAEDYSESEESLSPHVSSTWVGQ